jgi:hypothetical protein
MDRAYDYASIQLDEVAAHMRRLARDAVAHVLADAAKPALSAKAANLLAPVVLPPQYGTSARRRGEALLRRPLRLTHTPTNPHSFGPLELVAAAAAQARGGLPSPPSLSLGRGGVDSGAEIFAELVRTAFSSPTFREEVAILATERLAREVVLLPPLPRPISFGDSALVALIAMVGPRPKVLWRRGTLWEVETALVANATAGLVREPLTGFDAWLIAEAAERFLAEQRTSVKWNWREWLFGNVGRTPIIANIAANGIARFPRYPLLGGRGNPGLAGPTWSDDDETPVALRLYLNRHF